jgi:hypothetical protein
LVGLLVGLGCVGPRVFDGLLVGLGAASSATSIDRSSVAKKELFTGAVISVKNIVRFVLREILRYPRENIRICDGNQSALPSGVLIWGRMFCPSSCTLSSVVACAQIEATAIAVK